MKFFRLFAFIAYIFTFGFGFIYVPYTASASTYYVIASSANVRECPQATCRILVRLRRGTAINVINIVEGDVYRDSNLWLQIDSNGQAGYIHTSLMATADIATAKADLCTGLSSETIAAKTWRLTNPAELAACVRNLLTWDAQAVQQQSDRLATGQCAVQPLTSDRTTYFENNWALTDISIGYFNLGKRLAATGDYAGARSAFETIINKYSCAWVWDPRGRWFWSMDTGARTELGLLP